MSRRTDEKEKQVIEPGAAAPGDAGTVESVLGTSSAERGAEDTGEPKSASDPSPSTEGQSAASPHAAGVPPDQDPGLFKIERIPEARRMTGVTVQTSPRTTVKRFPLDEETWRVDRPTAQAAVRTGAFRIAEDSKAKLKE